MKIENPSTPSVIDHTILIKEMKFFLDQEFDLWYPIALDTFSGGYLSDINYKWEAEGRQNKMIVSQARHIWSASNAAIFYQDKSELLDIAAHGFEFLKNKMWDTESGGFYDLVNREGKPIKENGEIIKRAYGNSFAIYGLAAYHKASGNTDALKLAQETFYWLEKNSYDPEYGGYFQFMSRDGTPFKEGYLNNPPKDQNSSIHLLECFTELYSVWKDETLKKRLTSLLHIIRDTITTEKGYMVLFFNRNWNPVSFRNSSKEVRTKNYEFDHVSFGHDIETAYLLLEASETLGLDDEETLIKAKKMVDHTLKYGWDKEYGGIFDGGYYFNEKEEPVIIRNTKEWWCQSEALNSLLMMSEFFPENDLNYYEKFITQWDYIKKYLIDEEHGGWFWGGIDKAPGNKFSHKGTIWKVNYHTSRSLINCIEMLGKKSEKHK
jgi:mannobiose 2-epimerase